MADTKAMNWVVGSECTMVEHLDVHKAADWGPCLVVCLAKMTAEQKADLMADTLDVETVVDLEEQMVGTMAAWKVAYLDCRKVVGTGMH